jgi:phosphatidylglycerol:prolipoprotein diacylglycerol transferase
LVALAYAVYSCRRSSLDPRSMYWAGVCACLGGLFGGHLMGLFVHGWPSGPFAVLRFWDSSKSYYGGLIGGAVALMVFCRLRRLSVLSYADASTPAVALGYAVGRVGCFLNGDDYGTLTRMPWAVTFPPGTEAYQAHLLRGWIHSGDAWTLPVHPVQLYASLTGLGLFAILTFWRGRRPGDSLWLFAALYGAARFLLEYLRGDFRAVLGPFSLPQIFSLALLGAGIAFAMRGTSRLTPPASHSECSSPRFVHTLTRRRLWS